MSAQLPSLGEAAQCLVGVRCSVSGACILINVRRRPSVHWLGVASTEPNGGRHPKGLGGVPQRRGLHEASFLRENGCALESAWFRRPSSLVICQAVNCLVSADPGEDQHFRERNDEKGPAAVGSPEDHEEASPASPANVPPSLQENEQFRRSFMDLVVLRPQRQRILLRGNVQEHTRKYLISINSFSS